MCFHCIIHKEALFTKHINLLNTMEVAIRIISKVRGFLQEIDVGDLGMYT